MNTKRTRGPLRALHLRKKGVWNSCSQIYSELCNSTEGGCSFPLSQLVNGFHICSFKEGPLLNMVPPLEEEVVDHQSEPRE
ncbi:unnamed protein product, partial [Vitis vinifera]